MASESQAAPTAASVQDSAYTVEVCDLPVSLPGPVETGEQIVEAFFAKYPGMRDKWAWPLTETQPVKRPIGRGEEVNVTGRPSFTLSLSSPISFASSQE